MEESLLGIAADVQPTKYGLNDNKNKKFSVNQETGEKTRLKANQPRKS